MDRGTTFPVLEGFPVFYRTHKSYNKSYDLFSFRIFIHRNPMDTLISSYYFYRDRNIPFLDDPKYMQTDLLDIDFYVRYKLDDWISFYYESIKHASIILNYTQLKNDCFFHISRLVREMGWKFSSQLIEKSIQISSFENVKHMGKIHRQEYGNGPKDGSFKGKFTRSGKEGQFHNELSSKTLDYVIDRFPDFIILYPDLID